MSENAQKPRIRFKGFSDAWEQRKLGELSEKTYGGGTPSTANTEYWRGNIPWLQSSDIIEGKLFDVKPKKYISQLGLNNSAAQLVPANSIAIITRVGVGKLAFLPFPYTTSQDFLSMSRLTAEPYFTVYACYKKLQSELNSVQGTSIKGITKDELLAKEIKVPSYEEQTKIGEHFRNLDNLITLHQRKYDKLVAVKKSLLEKMFPADGETVPKIRFKGFSDAWEQRKLGELSEKTYGGGTPSTANTEYWRGNIPWLQSSDIIEGKLFDVKPKKYISQLGLNNSAAQLVPANSIAIITRVGVGKLAFLPFPYTTSQDFLSMSRLTAEPYFTVYACYKKLQSELNSVQGTSIKGITKDELLAKEIKVPSYEEQTKIGEHFRNLDNLITLHQRQLEKLKNIKSALLEKMFV